jgi:hypothetical protein
MWFTVEQRLMAAVLAVLWLWIYDTTKGSVNLSYKLFQPLSHLLVAIPQVSLEAAFQQMRYRRSSMRCRHQSSRKNNLGEHVFT